MLSIWRFLLEKVQYTWLQLAEFSLPLFFMLQAKLVVLPWVLWCLDQNLPQLSRRWLGYVRFCFKKPSPHTPPIPPCPWWEVISFQGFLCEYAIGREGTRKFTTAMNVCIFFSRIVAHTELILSRHIFWLKTCEMKTVFFSFLIWAYFLPQHYLQSSPNG